MNHAFQSVDSDGAVAVEHNWLDARLAAAFMKAASGAIDEAAKELTTYRLECAEHLHRTEARLFSSLEGLDERTLAAEKREWAAHARDVRQAARAAQAALHAPRGTPFLALQVLHRAVSRHRADEARLMELAAG